MKFDQLSSVAQQGLRVWAIWQHRDELLLDDLGSSPEHWAWVCIQLRVAEDLPEFFPKGKSATIQVIEQQLYTEAIAARRDWIES
jgi:hypothetical protein